VDTRSLKEIVRIQNDFSRSRRALQRHVKNPKKRIAKLRETRGRQRNRIKDALHKLSTNTVRENPDASFVFEDLRGIRKTSEGAKRRSGVRSSGRISTGGHTDSTSRWWTTSHRIAPCT
jgi:putative transposase